MDDLRDDEKLTTADIANPVAARDVRSAEDVTRGDSVRDNFRRERDELRTDVRTNEVSGNEAPVLRTSDVAAQAQAAEQGAMANRSATGNAAGAQRPAQLFPDDELHNYRARWDQVQTSFVDEPRKAVEEADSLVANVVKRIAEQFANERAELEKQWDRGNDVSTEDLRQGLRRYRAFFDRLLSV